jgi:hypothetical protein
LTDMVTYARPHRVFAGEATPQRRCRLRMQ